MITKTISTEHILKAIEEINNKGVPLNRVASKFSLKYMNKQYPPKYVISIANKYANGEELSLKLFSGGQETNKFLKKLGFEIVLKEE